LIQLDFIRKNKSIREKEVSDYYKRLSLKCRKNKIEELNDWCDHNLDMDVLFPKIHSSSKMKSFEKVVTADFQTLLSIRDFIFINPVAMDESLKNYLIDRVYQRHIERLSFIMALGVIVCPYCNRNFVNPSGRKTNCQFDHFINKSKYPILAVSFYNLVPVCASCNHVKSNQDFSYSPYDDTVQTDEMVTFSYDITGAQYLSDSEQLQVILKTGSNNKLQDNINILELQDVYQIHKDIVQELLIKKEIYTEEYQDQLYGKFESLFGSRGNFERLITGAYTDSESYGRRPLSKMIADICKELGLI
jgi:hypothetical protein